MKRSVLFFMFFCLCFRFFSVEFSYKYDDFIYMDDNVTQMYVNGVFYHTERQKFFFECNDRKLDVFQEWEIKNRNRNIEFYAEKKTEDEFVSVYGTKGTGFSYIFPLFEKNNIDLKGHWAEKSFLSFNFGDYVEEGKLSGLDLKRVYCLDEVDGDICIITFYSDFNFDCRKDIVLKDTNIQRIAGSELGKIWFSLEKGMVVSHSYKRIMNVYDFNYNKITLITEGNNGNNDELKRFRNIYGKANRIGKKLKKTELGYDDYVITKDGVIIGFDNINFEPDRSNLTPKALVQLEKINEVLKTLDNKIQIRGYCADVGDEKSKYEISRSRAFNVTDYFIKHGGVKVEDISYEGYGAANPLGDNSNEKGRILNRRVEIMVLY